MCLGSLSLSLFLSPLSLSQHWQKPLWNVYYYSLNIKNDHCEFLSLLHHYQPPSPSLCTRGQMWSRDSGEFVMSKCKIRQQAQLAEPEGFTEPAAEQSWVLLTRTRRSALPRFHWLKCVPVWYVMYGLWVRAFQRATWVFRKKAVLDIRVLTTEETFSVCVCVCLERDLESSKSTVSRPKRLNPVLVCEVDCKSEG